jgi:S-DNA-T family DNA segregation ATPase FtsK/SpoIIIE
MSRGRRKAFKLKLKKKTIYTIFGIGFLLGGIFFFFSLLRGGESTAGINLILREKFGPVSILFPFVLMFFGFLFLNLKIYISRINVTIGYLLLFISLLGLTKGGSVGGGMFTILEEILTRPGADVVLIGGLLVGSIVFFDTSIDEIIQFFGMLFQNIHRLIPTGLFSGQAKGEKAVIDRNKPMIIKGGHKEEPMAESVSEAIKTKPTITKGEPELLPNNLVSNSLAGTGSGVWEYPSLDLLSSDTSGHKAERGDIKKIAHTIEATLDSFGVSAKVAEVNLGPAVTQYALEIAQGTKISKITSLANDLALATEAPGGQIRIEAPIPGRNLVVLKYLIDHWK